MTFSLYSDPRFTHDCTSCKYLGHILDHDIYYCEQGYDNPTIVARFGDDGEQYISGLHITLATLMNRKKMLHDR